MTDPNDVYLNTVGRLEPNIVPVDTGAALASIAISLKRIADAADNMNAQAESSYVRLEQAIWSAITQGLKQ